MLDYSVQLVKIVDFSNFNNVAMDGTSTKASNNKFNVIHKTRCKIFLLSIIPVKLLDNEELKSLRLSDSKIMNRKNMLNIR